MEENKSNWIKAYIVDVLPCLSIAFFVLAYVYNAAYFSVFDIDIIKYATFGDIFITITEPLCFFAFFVALLMAFSYKDFKRDYLSKLLEEEKYNKYKIKLPYSWLRFMAREKNKKWAKYYRSFEDFIRSIILSILLSTIRIIRKLIPDLYLYLLLLLLIGAISEKIFFYFLKIINIQPTLTVVAPALILPLIIIPSIIAILRGFYSGLKVTYKKNINNYLTLKFKPTLILIGLAFSYYIYAIGILMDIGFLYGKNQKEHNNISFTIKTSDGTVFDNKSYGYIAHLSEKTFLFSKKDHDNVVLFNENITYTKIKEINNDKKAYEIIVSSYNNLNEKIKNIWSHQQK